MESRQQIQERRQQLVEEMLQFPSMKRGTLNEQFLRVPRKGHREPALRGPYYVLSRKEKGKTVSQRVAPEDLARVREDIARHRRFLELCRALADLTEQLGELAEGAEEEAQKKTANAPSRRTRKSRG